jgi:teichuronic acid biosynthesis glycosyltransferase TuaH
MAPERRLLFLSHLDWRWITQRPHFLAGKLAAHYEITVAFLRAWRRKHLSGSDPFHIRKIPLFYIPFAFRARATEKIAWNVTNLCARLLIAWSKPSVIWITWPAFGGAVPAKTSAIVVYDCMDDNAEIVKDAKRKQETRAQEAIMVKRADLIFVSSNRLMKVLNERYGAGNRSILVHNAFGGEFLPASRGQRKNNQTVRLCYFGTVGPWFDFATVQAVLAAIPGLEIHLFGLVENTSLPDLQGLFHHGIVSHAELAAATAEFDCFVMPFVLNDLVLAVDPVKLYEYINFDKPIICVRYPEVERFSPFVDFYDSAEDFVAAIKRLQQAGFEPKYSEQQRQDFLLKNSWDSRTVQITSAISKLIAKGKSEATATGQ